MNRLITVLAFTAVALNSSFSFASYFNVNDILNNDKVYNCTVWNNDKLDRKGEARIVFDENVLIDEVTGEQLSTARVLFENDESRRLRGIPVVMNLFHTSNNGNIESLEIEYSRVIHLRHRSGEPYKPWPIESNQVLTDRSIPLKEGQQTSRVKLSEDLSEIEMFEMRQVVKDRVFGIIPKKISDFRIICNSTLSSAY